MRREEDVLSCVDCSAMRLRVVAAQTMDARGGCTFVQKK